jgi:hypothetical protein
MSMFRMVSGLPHIGISALTVHGLLKAGVDFENPVQTGQLEHRTHSRLKARQRESART